MQSNRGMNGDINRRGKYVQAMPKVKNSWTNDI